VFDAVNKYDVNNPELTEFIRFVVMIEYKVSGFNENLPCNGIVVFKDTIMLKPNNLKIDNRRVLIELPIYST
jgi:hypothetical protein